jgi:2-phospho-L-lactate transferase CofD
MRQREAASLKMRHKFAGEAPAGTGRALKACHFAELACHLYTCPRLHTPFLNHSRSRTATRSASLLPGRSVWSQSAAVSACQPSSKDCAHMRRRAGETRDVLSTAVVTVTETAETRDVTPRLGLSLPGDVRNCLAAIAKTESPFRQLLQHRFNEASE